MNQVTKPAEKSAVPEGFREDARGCLVPLHLIDPIDLVRDDLVNGIVLRARQLSAQLAEAKENFFDEIAAFVNLSADEYNVHLGGKKGNVTLTTFDGRYQVIRAISEKLVFDERLQAAKALIDSCLQRWSAGAQPEIIVLINDAFQVDKAGNINTNRVLTLRRLKIVDEEWLRAMVAISDALQVAGSRSYVRIYERVGTSEKYQAITLDLAGA